jgi:hypothetical protein
MPYLYGAGAYGYASPYYGAYSYPSAYYGAAYASPYYGAYSSYYSPYSYAGYGYGYGGLYGRGYYSPSQPKDDCQAMAAELIRGSPAFRRTAGRRGASLPAWQSFFFGWDCLYY